MIACGSAIVEDPARESLRFLFITKTKFYRDAKYKWCVYIKKKQTHTHNTPSALMLIPKSKSLPHIITTTDRNLI